MKNPRLHSVRIKAHSSGEELEETLEAIHNILPEELQGLSVEKTRLGPEDEAGVFTEPIYVLELKLNRQKEIKQFIEYLNSKLIGNQKKKLLTELPKRVDELGNFYLRLGKERAANGKFKLESKDAIQVKLKPAVYIKTNIKEKAVELIKQILE